MLLLNDQLKHHLENWEADPKSAVDSDDIDEDSLPDDTSDHNHNHNDHAQRLESNDSSSARSNHMLMTPCWDALILVVGFLSGIYAREYWNWNWNWVGVSFWTVAIAVVLGSVSASVVCGNSLRRLQRTRRSAVLQAQRVELASLLSRIGAPPPFLSKVQIDLLLDRDNPTDTLQDVIDLVKSFAQLLTTIDSSLDRIKSATSMELGLGIWSPAVSRVEHHRRPMRTSCASITAKTVLAQGLQRGLELFQPQTQSQTQSQTNYSICEVRGPITIDTVVTISSLQMARRDLVLALTHSIWMPRSAQDTKYCVDTMEEIDAYLRASFWGHHEDESSSLHRVAQHMHAAEIALWAYSRETENEIARQEWIQRFHALLKMANALQESKHAGSSSDTRPENEQVPSSQSLQSEVISSPLSFEDTGNVVVGTNGVLRGQEAAQRTLVFSGKGLVPRERPQRVAITTPSLPSSTTAGSAVAQAMLFQELQTYLAAIANADEVSVNGVHDHCEEDVEDAAQGDDTSGRRFVIPDRLLAELALSISEEPPGGETLEIFCDSPFPPLEESSS